MLTRRNFPGIRRFTQRSLSIGECVPWWMGIAYDDWERREVVAAVLPFNWIWAWLRAVAYWLKFPSRSRFDKLTAVAAARSYFEGFEQGKIEGRRLAEAEFRATVVSVIKQHVEESNA